MLIVDKLKGNLYTRIKKHMTKKMYHLYYRENRKVSQSKEEYEDLIQEIYKVREDKQKALVASAEQQGVLRRIEEMNIYLDDASTELAEYDEGLVVISRKNTLQVLNRKLKSALKSTEHYLKSAQFT